MNREDRTRWVVDDACNVTSYQRGRFERRASIVCFRRCLIRCYKVDRCRSDAWGAGLRPQRNQARLTCANPRTNCLIPLEQ